MFTIYAWRNFLLVNINACILSWALQRVRCDKGQVHNRRKMYWNLQVFNIEIMFAKMISTNTKPSGSYVEICVLIMDSWTCWASITYYWIWCFCVWANMLRLQCHYPCAFKICFCDILNIWLFYQAKSCWVGMTCVLC